LRFKGRVAAIAAKVGDVAKSSEKALVKRFCEKNFTEFLSDLKKWSAFFYLPPPFRTAFLNLKSQNFAVR